MTDPHPSSDSRLYSFDKDGRMRPKAGMRRPRIDTAFAWWMYKRKRNVAGLAKTIGCSEPTVERARQGRPIMWFYARAIRARWPDAPVRIRGTVNLKMSPAARYLGRKD